MQVNLLEGVVESSEQVVVKSLFSSCQSSRDALHMGMVVSVS